jgi:hypothetical protein
MQWAQDPNQNNVNNLNNVRRKPSSHFRKKREYLSDEIEKLENKAR